MFTQEEIRRLLDIACLGNQKGNILESREIFQSILSFYPEHSGALLGLANNYMAINDFAKAEEILQQVINKNENDIEAKVLLGITYFISDRTEQAKPLLEEVKNSTSPSNVLAEYLLTLA